MPNNDLKIGVSFNEAVAVWLKIGWLSFGGPVAQIALMHKILVDEKRWISEERFLHALNYCMLLPGPEAQQLATYIGWLFHGRSGGLTAGLLFILPGFFVILLLSIVYALNLHAVWFTTLFTGIKAAVLAIVLQAIVRIGKKTLKNKVMYALAFAAFISIFILKIPFPLIVIGAGLFGFIAQHKNSQFLPQGNSLHHSAVNLKKDGKLPSSEPMHNISPSWFSVARTLAIGLTLWFMPVFIVACYFGSNHVYTQESLFFSKMAVVTFGGAYAVLSYLAQAAVQTYAWLAPGEMIDGLGLAETTPGPLIMVTEFVGFLAAYRHAHELNPLMAGTLGAILTTWVTFVPCFLWIFLGAPYVETLRNNLHLSAALSCITAAIVGVILNLTIWFGLHVLFQSVESRSWYFLHFFIPDWHSLDIMSLVIASIAVIAILRFKMSVMGTIAICGTASMLYSFV